MALIPFVFACLQMADVYSTIALIERGLAYEANPLVGTIGFGGLIFLKLCVTWYTIALYLLVPQSRKLVTWATMGMVLLLLWHVLIWFSR